MSLAPERDLDALGDLSLFGGVGEENVHLVAQDVVRPFRVVR